MSPCRASAASLARGKCSPSRIKWGQHCCLNILLFCDSNGLPLGAAAYYLHQLKVNDKKAKAMTIFRHSSDWPYCPSHSIRSILIAHSSDAFSGHFLGSSPQMLTLTKAEVEKQELSSFSLSQDRGNSSVSSSMGISLWLRAATLDL